MSRSHGPYVAAIALAGAMLGCVAASNVEAQGAYPNQPIRFVVPNPPGGLPDIMMRLLTEPLRERLGQPMIVENRPGASAGIGAAVVTASKPDGYTFLVSDSSIISTTPLLQSKLPHDPKDLMPVSLIARAHIFLAAHSKLPVNNLKELVDYVKANPDKLNYGSIGVGSFHHLSMEAMMSELGLKLSHIPYKGSGESVTALRGGHIDLVFASYAALIPAVKSQQAKLIASNGAQRSSQAPEVPVIADIIPGFDLSVTQSLYARAGTPADIVNKIAAEIAAVVKLPGVVEKFAVAGIDPVGGAPDVLAQILAREAISVGKIVKAAGLKPN